MYAMFLQIQKFKILLKLRKLSIQCDSYGGQQFLNPRQTNSYKTLILD